MTTKAKASENGWQPSTVEEWHARATHRIELHNARVLVRFRSLGELIAHGELPDDLIKLALLELSRGAGSGGITGEIANELAKADLADGDKTAAEASLKSAREIAEGAARLVREQVAFALVEPKLTAEDLAHPDFPMEDLELLAGILNRQIEYDAAGRRIGIEPLATFRVFAQAHGCPAEGCPACEEARLGLSTVHVGGV